MALTMKPHWFILQKQQDSIATMLVKLSMNLSVETEPTEKWISHRFRIWIDSWIMVSEVRKHTPGRPRTCSGTQKSQTLYEFILSKKVEDISFLVLLKLFCERCSEFRKGSVGCVSDDSFCHRCPVIRFRFCATTFYFILLGIYRTGASFCSDLNSTNKFKRIFRVHFSFQHFRSNYRILRWYWWSASAARVRPARQGPQDLSQVVLLRSISCEFAHHPGTLGIPVHFLTSERHQKNSW